MGFLAKAGAAIKSALRWPAYGGQGLWSGGIYDWMTWQGGQGYDYREAAGPLHRNGTVMACAAWIMRAFPEPPVQVIKEDAAGEDNEVPKHPLTRAFRKPNPFYGADCLWQRVIFDRSIHGQAYIYKIRNGDGDVIALYHVPQHRIIPQWNTSGMQFIDHYILRVDARQETIPIQDLVHFRFGGDPDHERSGLASLGAGLREIGALNEGSAYRGQILRNMGVPSHILQPRDAMRQITSDEAKELHRKWAERVSGTNRGKPIIPNWALEAIKLGYSPEELDLGNMLDEPADLVCALFGLSSMVVGLSSGTEHRTYCLPADARVETLDGAMPIADVRAGDTVWSFLAGRLEPRRVLRQWKTGTKQLFRVRTKNRILLATDNHPVLVRVAGARGGGDNDDRRVRYDWKPVGELKPGDHVVQIKFLPDQEGTLLPNGEPATPRMMQFLGALIGDGSVRERWNGGVIEMAMPANDRVGAHYREAAKALWTRHGGAAVSVSERPRSFACCSTEAARTLIAWGFSGTAKTKRIPGWVFRMSESLRLAFLAGLVDSDGHVQKRGVLQFSFANQVLTNQVRELMVSCGIQCCNVYHGIFRAEKLRQSSLDVNWKQDEYHSWAFVASSAVDVARIPFADPLYRERVEANRNRHKSDGLDAWKTGLADHLGFYQVISIEPAGMEDVYDLEVEGGHSFVADGVVVHNSNYKEARQAATETALIPAWKQIGQDLTLQLLPDYEHNDDECVTFNLTNVRVLQEDHSATWNRVVNAYQAQIIDRYRALQGLGLKPEESDKGIYYQKVGGVDAPGTALPPMPPSQAAALAPTANGNGSGNGNGRTAVGAGA